jgi:hypothetical protein
MSRTTTILATFIVLAFAGCPAPETSPGLGTTETEPLVVSLAHGGGDLRLGAAAGAGDPIRLHVEGNSADPSYRTNWTLGAGTCLRVVPRIGDPVVVTGAPIASDYYHLGRALGVSIGSAPSQNSATR